MIKRFAVATFLMTLLCTASAFADNGQDEYFRNCMGGESVQQDPQRAEYCNCVRNGMQSWDTNTMNSVADEVKAQNGAPPPALETLAKSCIAKIMK